MQRNARVDQLNGVGHLYRHTPRRVRQAPEPTHSIRAHGDQSPMGYRRERDLPICRNSLSRSSRAWTIKIWRST